MSDSTKVAIACQGGGSHTAFTAGVLTELLREWDDEYELVGISGTSGGAFNALATWYGLVTADAERSIDLLDALWEGLTANSPSDRVTNEWVVGLSRIESSGLPFPQISPYQNPGSNLGKRRIERVLRTHIDFDEVPALCRRDVPELVVGTVNVNAGTFETFTNEDVTPEVVLASAAVPNLFEAVEIDGHYHWDGLFSQNPPIDDLMTVEASRKPDELWVIQINPQVREGEPSSLEPPFEGSRPAPRTGNRRRRRRRVGSRLGTVRRSAGRRARERGGADPGSNRRVRGVGRPRGPLPRTGVQAV